MMLAARALGFLALLLAAHAAVAEEKVRVDAAPHEGYARIAFAWPDQVAFETHLDGRTLTLHFGRPFTADLGIIPRRIDPYVERAAMQGDSDVVLTLRRELGLRSFATDDKKIVLDLLDRPAEPAAAKPAPSAPPPPKPAAASPPPAAAALAVRVEESGDKRRLVFPWPHPVSYSVSSGKAAGQLRFRNAPAIDPDALAAAVPDLDPKLTGGGKEQIVTLALPAEGRLHATREGASLVVELPPAAVPPPTAAAAPAAPAPPAPVSGPAAPPAPPAEAASPGQPSAAVPPAAAEATPAPESAEKTEDAASPLPLRYAAGDDGASLRFEWSKPVGVAAFRRGQVLWLVFGAPIAVNLGDLREHGRAAVRAADQIANPAATILRLTTLGGYNPSIRKADSAWIVELRPQLLQPEAPVGVTIQPSGEAPRLFFATRQPGEPVTFRDPEIGDTLVAVPVMQAGQGVAREERLVDLAALVTAQGVALRPSSDAVSVKSLPNGVEVTGSPTLILSDPIDRALRQTAANSRLFDFTEWYGAKDGDVLAQRRALQQGIVAAAPSGRSNSRLDLAHFYFARGYAAEAIGVVEAIARDDPSFAGDPKLRALAGGAKLLAGDIEGAAAELNLPALDAEPEAGLWRGSLAMAQRDPKRAAAEFAKGESFLRSYPKALRNRFALEAAKAALAAGQSDDAEGYLDIVLKDAPDAADRATAELLSAKALQEAGDSERADRLIDKLAGGGDRPTRARALLARTLEELDTGKITRADAVQALDGLRFAWRGDDFELTLLRRLGALKIADGDYRGGFEAWHQAMANFPNHPEHKAIAEELTAAFTDLFLGREADAVPPLKALALYDEFHDLTPSGAKGDEIISKLADRLVAIDLLDRAAGLLDEQVRGRLTGRDKARVAARLALVRLLDRKPDAALAALDIDVGGDIDRELLRQRQQLRARALAELGRSEEALKILADDNSRDADRLRADIAWRGKNWAEAAKILARLAPPPDGKLDEDAARLVLDWGTTLTLSGDQAGAAELGRRYGKAMEASPFKDAFRIIAGTAAPEGDIRQIVGKVAQIGDFQSFMASYKKKLADQKLSAIN